MNPRNELEPYVNVKQCLVVFVLVVSLTGCSESLDEGNKSSNNETKKSEARNRKEAEAILKRLNDWDKEELKLYEDIAAGNDGHRSLVIPSGETNGWIYACEEELGKLGFQAMWNREAEQYDLRKQ